VLVAHDARSSSQIVCIKRDILPYIVKTELFVGEGIWPLGVCIAPRSLTEWASLSVVTTRLGLFFVQELDAKSYRAGAPGKTVLWGSNDASRPSTKCRWGADGITLHTVQHMIPHYLSLSPTSFLTSLVSPPASHLRFFPASLMTESSRLVLHCTFGAENSCE